jgi:long-chain acyl-CoA synthetase
VVKLAQKYEYEKPDNLVESFEVAVEKWPNHNLFGTKNKNKDGAYEWVTYKQVKERIDNLRSGLSSLGVGKNDFVGIIANNCVEWFVGENATHGLLARWVPMYQKELFSVWKYIIKDANIKLLFVMNAEIYEKLKSAQSELPSLKYIIRIEGDGPNSIKDLEEKGNKNLVSAKHPSSYDVADLIYTSGTTGEPKGVLLSHGNLTFASKAGYHIYPDLVDTSVSLSHLPWAHSYALSAELHNIIQFGGSIGFMETLETLAADMLKVRPTHLMSVPRVFNKVYDSIHRVMEEEGGMKLKLFNMGVAEAKKKFKTGKSGFKFKLLDKMVLAKIRAKFGGRIHLAMTASAKMNLEIAEFFFSIGIPCYDCYGMTETSPVLTMNCPGAWKLGTVGKAVEKTRIVIDKSRVDPNSPDGEIVVFGPQVMLGYHNKPDKTKEIMTSDGGIRTGDRGRLDEEGFLYVTGRFKEEYKLANGKYVFPAEMEEDIKLIPWITNVMVYGDGKEFNVALLVPNLALLDHWAKEMNLSINAKELMSGIAKSSNAVKKLIADEVEKKLKGKYASYEIPKRFAFISEDFTVDNGLLTQTMKLKRTAVLSKYKKTLDDLYIE